MSDVTSLYRKLRHCQLVVLEKEFNDLCKLKEVDTESLKFQTNLFSSVPTHCRYFNNHVPEF